SYGFHAKFLITEELCLLLFITSPVHGRCGGIPNPTNCLVLLKNLGESDLFLGLTLAAYSAGALLFAPFVGVIDDKFQASKLITVSCAFVRFFGNLLYSIPINGYFPMFGRLISGLGAATDGILFSVLAKGTTDKNRAKAFLYLEALYSLGTMCGPTLGSALTFNMDIYGWKINAGNSPGFMLIFIWLALLLLALFLQSDLAENSSNETSVIENEDGHDPALPNSITVDSNNSSTPLSMVLAETSDKDVVEEDSEDDISLSKSVAEGCPPSSM
ncbi:Major facilitator superfamily domain-containing 8, partial [Paramuricea clavata]